MCIYIKYKYAHARYQLKQPTSSFNNYRNPIAKNGMKYQAPPQNIAKLRFSPQRPQLSHLMARVFHYYQPVLHHFTKHVFSQTVDATNPAPVDMVFKQPVIYDGFHTSHYGGFLAKISKNHQQYHHLRMNFTK